MGRSIRWAFGAALCAAAVCGGGSAAHAQSVALLGLSGEDGQDDVAHAITQVLRKAAADVPEWQLDDAAPSVAQLVLAHDCEIAEAECRAVIGEGLRVDRVIYGTTRGAPITGTVHIELMMFESASGKISGVAARDVPEERLESGALLPDARALLDEVRGVEPEPSPEPAPFEEAEPAASSAEADTDADASVTLEASSATSPEGASETPKWIGFGLLGVSALSAGLAVYTWTEIDGAADDPTFDRYRRNVGAMDPEVDDVCDEAAAGEPYGLSASQVASVDEQCDSAATLELLQYVFLGVTVVAGGVGAYLIISAASESEQGTATALGPRLSLSPRLDPEQPGFSATLRF